MGKLPLSYFRQDDVVSLAKDLLGKKLITNFDGIITSGFITETEAYRGIGDKASHAYNNRRTKRTEVMYDEGGVAYVYLIYGIHHLFNIVTNRKDTAEAILIRAIEPLEGIETMIRRRNKPSLNKSLTSGPGTLSEALGIRTHHTGEALNGDLIWLESLHNPPNNDIAISTRIGVDYAGEDALLPWRFYLKTSKYVSRL